MWIDWHRGRTRDSDSGIGTSGHRDRLTTYPWVSSLVIRLSGHTGPQDHCSCKQDARHRESVSGIGPAICAGRRTHARTPRSPRLTHRTHRTHAILTGCTHSKPRCRPAREPRAASRECATSSIRRARSGFAGLDESRSEAERCGVLFCRVLLLQQSVLSAHAARALSCARCESFETNCNVTPGRSIWILGRVVPAVSAVCQSTACTRGRTLTPRLRWVDGASQSVGARWVRGRDQRGCCSCKCSCAPLIITDTDRMDDITVARRCRTHATLRFSPCSLRPHGRQYLHFCFREPTLLSAPCDVRICMYLILPTLRLICFATS